MAEESSSKKEAGATSASSFQTILSTALVALSNLATDPTRKIVLAICSPLAAVVIAWVLQQIRQWYLRRRFTQEIKDELAELNAELADPATDPARKALIPSEIAELRKLRQKRFLKILEITE